MFNWIVSELGTIYLCWLMFINHVYLIYMNKPDLALNNLQWLICHETKLNHSILLTPSYLYRNLVWSSLIEPILLQLYDWFKFILFLHLNRFPYQVDVVCYQEKEGEVNSLTLLCLNQQVQRLTVKTMWMQVSSSHSMTCSLLNKNRNPGHSSIVTGWNSGRRKKSNDWPIDP